MALYIDENGTISLIQGDSGEIVVYGLDSAVFSDSICNPYDSCYYPVCL